jgi:hypothetical protein
MRLDGDVLTHRKTFVHRASCAIDEGRCEYLTLYRPDQLRQLLVDVGLTEISVHAGWTDASYDGGELLVVTARAPS